MFKKLLVFLQQYKTRTALVHRRKGFSLVEMSIVLTSIAAIMVITAGGSSLIHKARMGTVISDLVNFAKAVQQFEQKYDALPGDIADTSAIAGLSPSDSGNGNGVIDSNEALFFWKHLSYANLIDGKYDGVSAYSPGVGLPAGSIKGSGYSVYDHSADISYPSQALVLQFSGFSSSSNTLPILTPEDAKSIDLKLDDGNPNTGTVRATGSSASGACISGNDYNLSNSHASCILRFTIQSGASSINTSSINVSGCTTIGASREKAYTSDSDLSNNCPDGYYGKIIETCQATNPTATSAVGQWQISQKNCQPVVCSGGQHYGETRVIGCINGQLGSGITQTCGDTGIWINRIGTGNNCSTPSASNASNCPTTGVARVPQACGWEQYGGSFQRCTNNQWTDDPSLIVGNSCQAITCGGAPIGSVQTAPVSCGANFQGTVKETCTADGNWRVTTSTCKPTYGTGCTVGQTQNIGCPPDKSGSNIQECVSDGSGGSYWTTQSDNCLPTTCMGEPIGTTRVSSTLTCPVKTTGVVMEVCNTDGTWSPSYASIASLPPTYSNGIWSPSAYLNCTPPVCTAASAGSDGNASWPNALGGASVNGTCLPGYTGSANRNCNSDLTWSPVAQSCTPLQCPATPPGADPYGVWPVTNALSTAQISDNCDQGYVTMLCGANGQWNWASENTTHCVAPIVTPPWGVGAGLRVWLDGSDPTNGNGSPNPSKVSNWMDKSGYNNNGSLAGTGTVIYSLTGVINGSNTLSFVGNAYYTLGPTNFETNQETAFYLMQPTGFNSSGNYLFDSYSSPSGYQIALNSSLGIVISQNSSPFSGLVSCNAGIISLNSTHVITLQLQSGSNQQIYVDGNLASSGCSNTYYTPPVSGNNINIGGSPTESPWYQGYLGEVLIYNRALLDYQKLLIVNYLLNNWPN